MKIVQLVPLEETVPPQKYGGTELVAHLVTEELVKRGHQVYLLAAGGSHTSATLVPIIPQTIRTMYPNESLDVWRDYWKMASVAKMIDQINVIKPDIIHNHYAWRLILFESLIKYPIMSTIHGPLTSVNEIQTYTDHPKHPFISISDNQRKALPQLNWVKTVYNGIDTSSFDFNKRTADRDYFVFLGRTSPEKGLAEIIQMIRQTPYKLKIAAKVDTVDQEYFDTKIKPYIDQKQIEFVGEVDHQGKVDLLKKAKALLLWLNWEEPFGLVVPEANACGTSVIVNRRGSMPELVNSGENGFLVSTIEEMKQALDKVELIKPEACRNRVITHFSAQTMTDGYLEVAQRVMRSYQKH